MNRKKEILSKKKEENFFELIATVPSPLKPRYEENQQPGVDSSLHFAIHLIVPQFSQFLFSLSRELVEN